jgi:hypothetical protein
VPETTRYLECQCCGARPTSRDIVNSGTEGAAGDTFVINGNASSEQYHIYTLAAWDAEVATTSPASADGRQIVITRGGTAFANVIAELSEIEEIRINGVDPAGPVAEQGRRYLRCLRRLLEHQFASQHHHHRWRCRR